MALSLLQTVRSLKRLVKKTNELVSILFSTEKHGVIIKAGMRLSNYLKFPKD